VEGWVGASYTDQTKAGKTESSSCPFFFNFPKWSATHKNIDYKRKRIYLKQKTICILHLLRYLKRENGGITSMKQQHHRSLVSFSSYAGSSRFALCMVGV